VRLGQIRKIAERKSDFTWALLIRARQQGDGELWPFCHGKGSNHYSLNREGENENVRRDGHVASFVFRSKAYHFSDNRTVDAYIYKLRGK
jgi:hypothetical protein